MKSTSDHLPILIRSPKVLILVVFSATSVLALPAIFVKVFAATVIATLECSPLQSHLILVNPLEMGHLP
jgi:hypothetical protein